MPRRINTGSSLEAEARRAELVEALQRNGTVQLADAAESLGVSEITIRRDLLEIERSGLARRVRGGAVAVGPQRFLRRQQMAAAGKQVISEKLQGLIPSTGSVVVDASSTMHRMAIDLHAGDLTVVTTGMETFAVLSGRPGVRAVLTGGELESSTGALVGPAAHRTIGDYVFDRAFVSPTFLDARLGVTEATTDGAEVKRLMQRASRSLVVAADASKLHQAAPARAFPISDIDVLVTDLDPGDARLDEYRDLVELL